MKKTLAAVALALLPSGCASGFGRVMGVTWGEPYAATREILSYAEEGETLLWVDLPFTFLLDTLFVPIDLLIYAWPGSGR